MKTLLSIVTTTFILTSCDPDPMGLRSAANRELDSLINDRLHSTAGKAMAGGSGVGATGLNQIHQQISEMWNTINLYDACTSNCEAADLYFEEWSARLHLDKQAFLKVSAILAKPQVIVAIKQNELTLLNGILTGN